MIFLDLISILQVIVNIFEELSHQLHKSSMIRYQVDEFRRKGWKGLIFLEWEEHLRQMEPCPLLFQVGPFLGHHGRQDPRIIAAVVLIQSISGFSEPFFPFVDHISSYIRCQWGDRRSFTA